MLAFQISYNYFAIETHNPPYMTINSSLIKMPRHANHHQHSSAQHHQHQQQQQHLNKIHPIFNIQSVDIVIKAISGFFTHSLPYYMGK